MPEVGTVLVTAALSIAGAALLVWLLSLVLRDASIVDIFWGPGFVIVAWASFFAAGAQPSARGLLLAGLASLWGLRLGGYLLWRNAGQGEDFRYVRMRKYWGRSFPLVSLGTVFGLQGALMWTVSLPLQLGQVGAASTALGLLDLLGAAVVVVGLFFEAVGDWQLSRFKADPANAGKVMDQGLWRYTRHPNYFGDFVVWWGLFLVAANSPYGIWSALGPAVMTYLLLRVSGVAMLERSLKRNRPDYEAYVARTSAFFPRPPRAAGS